MNNVCVCVCVCGGGGGGGGACYQKKLEKNELKLKVAGINSHARRKIKKVAGRKSRASRAKFCATFYSRDFF